MAASEAVNIESHCDKYTISMLMIFSRCANVKNKHRYITSS